MRSVYPEREKIMINFNVPPHVGDEEKYIAEAIGNHKICGDGPFCKRCAKWFEDTTGTEKALLTTSCTHATEMAAILADIQPGDEVIMPSYTFVSTADAFVLRGARVKFVDIRPDTMNIDEKLIEDAITKKTRAIVPVHYAGVSCEMDTIMAIAKKYNLTPVGTMAHEWIMCTGQGNHKHNPAYSNWYALDAWVREYGILNGTALTDAITTDCFLKDFQLTYATLFGGVRHDSGDPYEWGDKMIKHYESLGIDAANKTLLFSDSLDFDRADKLYRYFNAKAKVAFGIGTYISNDTDVPALNIVMKTTKCNGMDVAKISDNPGKGMCKNPEYVEYLQRCIDWRMNNDR